MPAPQAPPVGDAERMRARLEEYLRTTLLRAHLQVGALATVDVGHSGFTYFVPISDGEWQQELVMRVPPPGARLGGAADVARQGRIMAALHDFGFPTPAVVANCEDPAVLDGRPFCLTEKVVGFRIEEAVERFSPGEIAAAAIGVLQRLQAIPIQSSGLADDAPLSLEKELERWVALMERAPIEVVGGAQDLAKVLSLQMPPDPAPTIVHGDFQCGNMLFKERPGAGLEVAALLDWEIAQVGSPMLDITSLCVLSDRHWIAGAPNPGGGVDLDPAEVMATYGSGTHDQWYLALSFYKYAAIFGYNLSLHRRGKRPDAMYEGLTEVIPALVERGRRLLD